MGVYTRFKRGPEGFRALVELLESTPASRRQRMIEAGMAEDPEFTERALSFVLTFEDLVRLSDLELAELIAKAPPRITGFALCGAEDAIRTRFLRNAIPTVMAEVKSYLDVKAGPREVDAARLKLVSVARELEKAGLLKTKRLPTF